MPPNNQWNNVLNHSVSIDARQRWLSDSATNLRDGYGVSDVRFGSQADICGATSHVRFTPNSDRESGHPPRCMSAFLPKADMCGAMSNVCYGPIADINSPAAVRGISKCHSKSLRGGDTGAPSNSIQRLLADSLLFCHHSRQIGY